MKFWIALLVCASFLSVAVFGIAAMRHATMGHTGCAASVAQGVLCPEALTAASFLGFHFAFFQSLTSALIIAVVAIILSAFLSIRLFQDYLQALRSFWTRTNVIRPVRQRLDLIGWLSRLEASPTHS